jgi:hypothetical protein
MELGKGGNLYSVSTHTETTPTSCYVDAVSAFLRNKGNETAADLSTLSSAERLDTLQHTTNSDVFPAMVRS